jgi:hypothetical protein
MFYAVGAGFGGNKNRDGDECIKKLASFYLRRSGNKRATRVRRTLNTPRAPIALESASVILIKC